MVQFLCRYSSAPPLVVTYKLSRSKSKAMFPKAVADKPDTLVAFVLPAMTWILDDAEAEAGVAVTFANKTNSL